MPNLSQQLLWVSFPCDRFDMLKSQSKVFLHEFSMRFSMSSEGLEHAEPVTTAGRGKPVLISILACSLGFHAITLERSSFMKIAFCKIKLV